MIETGEFEPVATIDAPAQIAARPSGAVELAEPPEPQHPVYLIALLREALKALKIDEDKG